MGAYALIPPVALSQQKSAVLHPQKNPPFCGVLWVPGDAGAHQRKGSPITGADAMNLELAFWNTLRFAWDWTINLSAVVMIGFCLFMLWDCVLFFLSKEFPKIGDKFYLYLKEMKDEGFFESESQMQFGALIVSTFSVSIVMLTLGLAGFLKNIP